ncbi:hypothetical protein [Fibrobacter sp.]|nr:hypothetical protein [Fibrobacter sp.]
MIHFTHVTKSYEANWKALNNVTFRINKGEFVFLTGIPVPENRRCFA